MSFYAEYEHHKEGIAIEDVTELPPSSWWACFIQKHSTDMAKHLERGAQVTVFIYEVD